MTAPKPLEASEYQKLSGVDGDRDCKIMKLELNNSLSYSNGWIKTTDKVPDNQKPVLLYIPPHTGDDNEDYIGYVGLAYYTYSVRGGYWCGTDGNVYGAIGMIHSLTYWMSLPNPPEPI